MTAENYVYESEPSEVMYLVFDDISDVDDLTNVSMSRPNDTTVYLEWHRIKGIEGYYIRVELPKEYEDPEVIRTKNNNVTRKLIFI